MAAVVVFIFGWPAHLWHIAADRPEIGVERVRQENGLQFLLLLLLRSSPAFPLALSLRHFAERESTWMPSLSALSSKLPPRLSTFSKEACTQGSLG